MAVPIRIAVDPTAATPRDLFARDGFVALPRAIPATDLAPVRTVLDELFAAFDQLPAGSTHDVGGDGSGRAPRNPEVHRAATLRPELRETLAFARLAALARDLLGEPADFLGDHAIYKPAFNQAETAWHQDYAYSAHVAAVGKAVHLWVPLQDTPAAAGCMRFVPGSHLDGLWPHERLSSDPRNGTLVARGVDEARAIVCPLPLGGVTAHGPLTLHAAGANQTANVRRAWILHFGPRRTLGRRIAGRARKMLRLDDR